MCTNAQECERHTPVLVPVGCLRQPLTRRLDDLRRHSRSTGHRIQSSCQLQLWTDQWSKILVAQMWSNGCLSTETGVSNLTFAILHRLLHASSIANYSRDLAPKNIQIWSLRKDSIAIYLQRACLYWIMITYHDNFNIIYIYIYIFSARAWFSCTA